MINYTHRNKYLTLCIKWSLFCLSMKSGYWLNIKFWCHYVYIITSPLIWKALQCLKDLKISADCGFTQHSLNFKLNSLSLCLCVCPYPSYLTCMDEHEVLVQDGAYDQRGFSTFAWPLSSKFFWKTMEHMELWSNTDSNIWSNLTLELGLPSFTISTVTRHYLRPHRHLQEGEGEEEYDFICHIYITAGIPNQKFVVA